MNLCMFFSALDFSTMKLLFAPTALFLCLAADLTKCQSDTEVISLTSNCIEHYVLDSQTSCASWVQCLIMFAINLFLMLSLMFRIVTDIPQLYTYYELMFSVRPEHLTTYKLGWAMFCGSISGYTFESTLS